MRVLKCLLRVFRLNKNPRIVLAVPPRIRPGQNKTGGYCTWTL